MRDRERLGAPGKPESGWWGREIESEIDGGGDGERWRHTSERQRTERANKEALP